MDVNSEKWKIMVIFKKFSTAHDSGCSNKRIFWRDRTCFFAQEWISVADLAVRVAAVGVSCLKRAGCGNTDFKDEKIL